MPIVAHRYSSSSNYHIIAPPPTHIKKKNRVLVKLKNAKIREKLGLVRHQTPTRFQFFYFFGNIWKHENNIKKTTTKFQKNKDPSWGLSQPATSEFFNLTRPLTSLYHNEFANANENICQFKSRLVRCLFDNTLM